MLRLRCGESADKDEYKKIIGIESFYEPKQIFNHLCELFLGDSATPVFAISFE